MDLGIYIHIPFCVKKCRYCDFFSYAATDDAKLAYTDALIEEIKAYGDIINSGRHLFSEAALSLKEEKGIAKLFSRKKSEKSEPVNISTIYIGGGTPSVMPGQCIRRILDCVAETFHVARDMEGPEITIEMNPATVTKEKLAEYMSGGVNRVSIGLQSANDNELALLGRVHTYKDFLDSYDLVRAAGYDNVNIDIMSALPGQNIRSYKDTLYRVIELEPEHISSYSLIIEPKTPFYTLYGKGGRLEHELPDEDTEREMYDLTVQRLAKAGYERYEISNYAEPGKYSRHNTSYWRRIPYLGFGAGASSFFEGHRWKNTTDMRTYLNYTVGDISRLRTEVSVVTRQDAMAETVFLGMRMTSGISASDFKQTFGTDIHEVFGEQIAKHVKNKTMIEEGDRLYLSERGLEVSNFVFSDFV